MNDKKLVEVWRKQFIEAWKTKRCTSFSDGRFLDDRTEILFHGFLSAKRSQPSVVLPKAVLSQYSYDLYDAEEIHERLTAAGIKYTIGE